MYQSIAIINYNLGVKFKYHIKKLINNSISKFFIDTQYLYKSCFYMSCFYIWVIGDTNVSCRELLAKGLAQVGTLLRSQNGSDERCLVVGSLSLSLSLFLSPKLNFFPSYCVSMYFFVLVNYKFHRVCDFMIPRF